MLRFVRQPGQCARRKRGADRRRPPHVAAGGKLLVPPINHASSLSACGLCFGPRPVLKIQIGQASHHRTREIHALPYSYV
jgi:hypothetical protein